MQPIEVLGKVLRDAGLPHHCALVEGMKNYFAPADSWENGGITSDKKSAYFALSNFRASGIEPTNYTVEILMDPTGDRDKYPDPLPIPPENKRSDPFGDKDPYPPFP